MNDMLSTAWNNNRPGSLDRREIRMKSFSDRLLALRKPEYAPEPLPGETSGKFSRLGVESRKRTKG